MNEYSITEVRRVLSGFDSVWQRVSGGQFPGTSSREDALPSLMEKEQALALRAAGAAQHFRNGTRSVLLRTADDARRRVRSLQAEHFIVTGEMCPPCPDVPPRLDKPEALRDAMLRASALAELYVRAAEDAAAAERRDMLLCFGRQCTAAAAELRAAIRDMFRVSASL